MNCYEYPEGAVNEDGADEAHCESHRRIGDYVAHEMSNGLVRVEHDERGYIDSLETMSEARVYIASLM